MGSSRLSAAILVLAIALLGACGNPSSSNSGQSAQSYKDTKSIVIDVLKSDDAQKVIEEASNKNKDKTVKLLSTGEGQQIQMAVKDILIGETGSKLVEKTMLDPKFAGDFAKSIQKTNAQMHKDLIKDPDYQKSLLDLMNTPEYQKLVMDSMKSPQYRQQMMKVIQESLQSPLYKAELMALFTRVLQEDIKPKEGKAEDKSKKEGGGDSGKQDGGGGGGEGDSGGGDEQGGSGSSKGKNQDGEGGQKEQ
ncbi:spore germination lipoprotein GerD [Paenibacillus aurantius]|uniref:Spore germination lipoprotein GerD n=1 Tax=Paenibacillus aurantius TaxID=2918900 RepID=A0AA96LGX9_9BACL|nr:spore germination lipoprotein GerD [Paenibacillus aurantius]WNQ11776.1 spore germination lipoprotein GerD [Paenibacillus aurantius]